MKTITFITGNPYKLEEDKSVLKGYGIFVEPLQINIDEIQHHDPLKITEAKVKSAYEKAGQPVVVNDSSWEIPRFFGFDER